MSDSSNGDGSGETRQDGDDERQDEGDTSLLGENSLAYRAVMIAVIAVGGVAVLAGTAGTFVVLTGGTSGGGGSDILGAYECEEFDGDPQVVHDTEYQIQQRILSPVEVSQFNASTDEGGMTITLETKGALVAASANEPDGRPINLSTDSDRDRVVLEHPTIQPVRLWVDAVAEGGTVTRMQLDICPPQ